MSWQIVRVGDLAEQVRGVSYGKEDASNVRLPGYLPVLRAGNITDEGLTYDNLVFVPAERVSARQKVRKHDVVVAASSGSLDMVGKAAMALSDFEGGFGAFCKVLRPSKRVCPEYFAHYFKTRNYRRHVSALAAGANINNLRNEHLDDLRLPLPPNDEQRRIAAILDKAEALRAKRRAALTQLDILTQAVFLDMFGDPERNPHLFPRARLGDIIEFVGGSQPPRDTFTSEPSPEVIRLVQIRDFKTDAFKTFIPRRLARRFFEADDVMIGRYGPPVFQILRGLSGSYNVALIKALPRSGVTKDFIFGLLQEPRLQSFVVARSERTAGQTGVNLDLLEQYPAYMPPSSLQNEYSRRIEQVDRLQKVQRDSLKEMNDLFISLQHRAFRGEL